MSRRPAGFARRRRGTRIPRRSPRAKGRGTVEGYDEYLLAHPEGLHADEARRSLRAAAARVKRVGQVFRDCEDCPELVVVPAGSYVMGSTSFEAERDEDEGPRHRVVIPEAFAVATTEVTRGEYAAFVRETGYAGYDSCRTFEDGEWKSRSGRDWRSPGYYQTDRHPVVCVSWDDVQRYLAWLSRKTGEGYRLPSESEWEYAARAGTDTSRHLGRRHVGSSAGMRTVRTRPSRPGTMTAGRRISRHAATATRMALRPGSTGRTASACTTFLETCGNGRRTAAIVGYDDAPADGRVWRRGNCSLRILRGGSWFSEPSSIRSANRLLNRAVLRNANVGFRVARAVPVPSEPRLAVGFSSRPRDRRPRSVRGRSGARHRRVVRRVPATSFRKAVTRRGSGACATVHSGSSPWAVCFATARTVRRWWWFRRGRSRWARRRKRWAATPTSLRFVRSRWASRSRSACTK